LLKDLTIIDYLAKTASGDPTPGGGSIAALCAAAAAGLSEMVANLTVGKKEYESVAAAMKQTAAAASELRNKMIAAIDRDPEAYNTVMAAFKLPKSTDEEKRRRVRAIQDALKDAAIIPMGVAEDAYQIMKLAQAVIAKGNRNAVTDGAVAVMAARTAALGAIYNVKINLRSIKDKAFVQKLSQKTRALENKIHAKEKEILAEADL
jgi:formiminotetrahydrofolate cyclodeaminase